MKSFSREAANPPYKLPPPIFDARCRACWFTAALLVLVVASFVSVGLDWAGFASMEAVRSMGRFVAEFFPPDFSPVFVNKVAWAAWETLAMSALGTAIAECTTLLVALSLAYRLVRERRAVAEPLWPWDRVMDAAKARKTLGANADIMVRTLSLLGGFAWFTSQGARFGDTMLAANHVLLQLVSASAYLLDGYAHATEVLVGRAVGARARAAFDGAVRSASELAGMTALVLTTLVWVAGPWVISLLTAHEPVRAAAGAYLPYAAVYVLLSFAAFQLDGIFIGATRTRDMRNAGLVSLGAFLAASWLLIPGWANTGLWIAFVIYVVTRGVTLFVRMPPLRRVLEA